MPDANVVVHPHCGEAGAIGAAMETLRVVRRKGESSFIGIDQAIDLAYQTINDESTVCHFCPNLVQPDLHRHRDARRPHQPLHLRLLV